MDTESIYFTHTVIPKIGATRVVLVENLAAVLEEFNSVNTVKVVLADNTSIYISCEAGLVTTLDKNLKGHCTPLAVHFIKMIFHLELFLNPLKELQEVQLLLLVL